MGINDEETDEYRACRVCTHTCQTTHDKGGRPVVVPRFYKTLTESAVHTCRNPYLCVPSGYIRDHIGKDVKEDFVLEDAMGSEWVVGFNRSGLYGGWKSFAADHGIERGDHLVAALTGTNRFLVHVFDKNGMEKLGIGKGSSPKTRSSKRKASMDGDAQLTVVQHSNREGGEAAVPTVRQEIENGQNGAYTLNRVTDHRPKLTLGGGQHSIEPQECHQGESSVASETSADSVEVLLAKAVLARAKRKKLRQRSSAASQERLPKVNPRDGVRCGPHYKVTQDVRARRKEDLITNGGLDEIEEHGVAQEVFVEELHHNEDMAMEDQGVAMEDQGVAMEDQGVAMEDQGVAMEDQGVAMEDQGVAMEDQGVAMEDQGMNIENPPEDPEAAALGMQHQSNGLVAEEQVEHGNYQQAAAIFEASLVKEEPMFEMEVRTNIPEHNVLHDDGKCANCGLPATPPPLSGVGVLNAVMIKSEDCEQLAEESPVKSPKPKTPQESPHPRRPSKSVPVTEGQKQKALEAAHAFSAETQNPSAVVAMRISFVEKTCSCFVSVKCAAIFPKVTRSLELEDNEGCVRKANWRPERRYMQGPGWKDFVDSHALEVDDVCVMEVVVNKEEDFRVRVHVFRAHEMRKDEVPATPSGARTRSEAKGGVSPGMSTLINRQDEKKRRRAEDKDSERTPDENLRKVVGRPKNLLTREPPVSKRVSKRTPEAPVWLKNKVFSVEANGEPSKVAKPGPTKALKQSKKKQGTDDSETLDASTPASTTLGDGSGSTQEKSARKQKKLKASSVDITDRRKSTNDKIKSQKLYNVVRLLDRRKGLNGVVFLVELDGEVIQSHKKGKVKQDESGHWWVPYDHFTSDFISCYVD